MFGLRRSGILGINRRNVCYTSAMNPRRFMPLVDDKLATKRECLEAGIPVPRLLAIARHHYEAKYLPEALSDETDFVLKPARGAMGNGILVLHRGRDGGYERAGGRHVSADDFVYHALGIISGLYSLAGHADVAMVEERLESHSELARISCEGVADVRVIVYRGVPVMAMTRLPTRLSGGRANLHQGAIGAGLDLGDGRISHAVYRGRVVTRHPDLDVEILGRQIPQFAEILSIAVAATDRTRLGYVGADLVVDARRGPVVLEMNARPGLSIQLANRSGLRPRLEAVDEALGRPDSEFEHLLPVDERVALGLEIASQGAQRKVA